LIRPFRVDVPDAVLADLRERIRRTRWPDQVPGIGWEQGTELAYLQDLLRYWAEEFDWREQERRLNAYPHFMADLDGATVHFVHLKRGGVPLILTHGWPSAFVEMLPLVPLLDGFDLVIPSLPGYGFSPRPPHTGVNYRYVARLWQRLMRELGYERYGAHGGDFGSGVAALMALEDPGPLIGIHLTNLDIGPEGEARTEAEREYLATRQRWDDVERGYSAIQSTKPQTLGYGLTDSPAGLAAWIIEKWRSWTDTGGDPVARFGADFLLTLITLYWVTGSITPSIRDYWDNRWTGVTVGDRIEVPTAIARFCHQFVFEGEPPREWVERLYNVTRWTPMPRGGHFAPVEEPELVAADLREFFSVR